MGYQNIIASFATNVGNDTLIRAWGSVIANAFANSGWTKCTDVEAGTQANWSTITGANTSVTVRGYEIWKMGDALQATYPVFLKIEYGGSQTAPQLWWTIGNGANASGNVTGNTSMRYAQVLGGNTSGVAYFSGDTNRFVIVALGNGRTSTYLFGIERAPDANGAPSNEGVLVLTTLSAFIGDQFAWTAATGNTTALEVGTWCIMTPSVNAQVNLIPPTVSQVPIYPIFHTRGGPYFNPGLNLVGTLSPCVAYSMTAQATSPNAVPTGLMTIRYYGNTHTYLPLTAGYMYPPTYRSTSNGIALLLRWE
jgi:hypothetical protein